MTEIEAVQTPSSMLDVTVEPPPALGI